MDLTGIEIKIIWKLHRRGKWGGAHTPIENAVKGFRKDRRGEASGAINRLIRQQILTPKPTSYGIEISLNRDQVATVERICEWYELHADTVEDRETYQIPEV